MVAKAAIIAKLAHRGQVDKGGVDYWKHLEAVACFTLASIDWNWEHADRAVAAAWLHDTVEDTPLSLDDLRQLGFDKITVTAVGLLTQDSRDSHADYIRRIREANGPAGTIARFVKLADLKHNSDPSRMSHMPASSLQKRYDKALAIMRGDIE